VHDAGEVSEAEAGERAVEVEIAVDEDLFGQGVSGERVGVPDNDVAVFAYVE